MKLWQDTLSTDTGPQPDNLLLQFEKANQLALEAAQEVESLRQSIQSLHSKESSLSSEECDMLDDLRNRVLNKVKAFEETNNKVYQMIGNMGQAQDHPTPPPTPTEEVPPTINPRDSVVFLKNKSSHFSVESEDNYDNAVPQRKPLSLVKSRSTLFPFSALNSKTASSVPSTTIDLSKLTKLYAEDYELPQAIAFAGRSVSEVKQPSPKQQSSSSRTIVANPSSDHGGRVRFSDDQKRRVRNRTPSSSSCNEVQEERIKTRRDRNGNGGIER
jgi:hypothetical protein